MTMVNLLSRKSGAVHIMYLVTCPRNLYQIKLEERREWKEQVEMKKSRYTEEHVVGAVNQMEAGRKVKELARELGVSEATLYAWTVRVNDFETPGRGVY